MQGTPDHRTSAIKNLLLLEREERPMRMLRACLERMGYKVLTSCSPEWTREMLADPGIDLLIVSIPPQEEEEHLAQLASVLGDRPVLFVEPETDRDSTLDPDTEGPYNIQRLSRPFTLDELDRKIMDSLNKTRMYP